MDEKSLPRGLPAQELLSNSADSAQTSSPNDATASSLSHDHVLPRRTEIKWYAAIYLLMFSAGRLNFSSHRICNVLSADLSAYRLERCEHRSSAATHTRRILGLIQHCIIDFHQQLCRFLRGSALQCLVYRATRFGQDPSAGSFHTRKLGQYKQSTT